MPRYPRVAWVRARAGVHRAGVHPPRASVLLDATCACHRRDVHGRDVHRRDGVTIESASAGAPRGSCSSTFGGCCASIVSVASVGSAIGSAWHGIACIAQAKQHSARAISIRE
eukprot:4854190-Prymnesium_polylepis.1